MKECSNGIESSTICLEQSVIWDNNPYNSRDLDISNILNRKGPPGIKTFAEHQNFMKLSSVFKTKQHLNTHLPRMV